MYDYIIGKVTDIKFNSIVLENNGIGYLIYVANPFFYQENNEYKIYIYQLIKEDDNSLFGFKNTNEKDFVIAYYNLPKETCLQIMAKDWGGKKVAVLAATSSSNLSTGGYLTGEDYSEKSECKDSTGVVFCRNQPMPLAKASSACNCGKNNTCSIAIWNF